MEEKDLPKPQTDLPLPEKELPKPATDIPLPEKEISANANLASQGQALRASEKKPNKPKRNISFGKILVAGIVILITLLAFGLIAYLMMGNQNESQMVNDNSSIVNENPTPTPDPTADWETYSVEEIGFEYKIPPNFPTLNKKIINGYTGTNIYITSDESEYTYSPIMILGTTSTNFVFERGARFTDFQGFIEKDGVYMAKLNSTTSFEAPSDSIKVFTNKNGVEILKIKGKGQTNATDGLLPLWNPGEEYVGAIINTDDDTYTGFAIQMKLTEENTEELFDQILSTFKFTDQANTADETVVDTSSWKTYEGDEFSFKYPPDFKLKNDYKTYIEMENDNDISFAVSREKYIKKTYNEPYSFDSFSLDRATVKCAADGPMGSMRCDEEISKSDFITASGNKGYKYILKLNSESYLDESEEITEKPFGPIYAIQDSNPETIFTISTSYENKPDENSDINMYLDIIASSFSISK